MTEYEEEYENNLQSLHEDDGLVAESDENPSESQFNKFVFLKNGQIYDGKMQERIKNEVSLYNNGQDQSTQTSISRGKLASKSFHSKKIHSQLNGEPNQQELDIMFSVLRTKLWAEAKIILETPFPNYYQAASKKSLISN